jgi:hypothetical protein
VVVDRTVHIPPDAADLHVGLVDEPAVTYRMAARPGSVDNERGEVLHPPLQGGVVGLDPALRGEFLEIAVGQAEAQYQRTASKITSGGNR